MRRRRRVSEEGPNAQSERAHNESKGGRDGGRGEWKSRVAKDSDYGEKQTGQTQVTSAYHNSDYVDKR